MPPLPLEIPPGIVKTRSPNAAKGRFTDGDKVRFVNGLPEKWSGCQPLDLDGVTLLGLARGSVAWSNAFGNPNASFGTHLKLYAFTGNDAISDITPVRSTGTLGADPFAVTQGSATVTVSHTAHGAILNDFVTFDGATAGGGITIDGEYQITSVIDADSYTIEHSAAATSTDASTGGASVTFAYQINTGFEASVEGLGYGAGRYGEEEWGSARSEGLILDLRTWSLEAYGNDLLANPAQGGLYLWQEAIDSEAEAVANAPTQIRAMFVTGERFIFALGDLSSSPMTVKWPDVDDPTDWTPSASNTANERTLQAGSKLMGGVALTDGLSLVWSDRGLYLFQYTGDAFIYSDRLVATGCGLAAPKGFVAVGGTAYWMSGQACHMFASGGAVGIPNAEDIADFVFKDAAFGIAPDHVGKTWAEYDQANGQVRWHYVSMSSPDGEPDRYVDVTVPDAGAEPGRGAWVWTVGSRLVGGRTTGTIFRPSTATFYAVDPDGVLYEHNVGFDDNGSAMESYIAYGLYAVAQGEENVDIMGVIPDFERRSGAIDFELSTKDRPDDETNFDAATYTLQEGQSIVDARVSGRHFSQTVRSNVLGGDYRLGIPKLEVQGAGMRR